MEVILQRFKEDKNQSTGTLTVLDRNGWPVFTCPCIERGNKSNQRYISAVPPGKYRMVLEYSRKFKRKLWELKEVPGRSEIKIHVANFWYELNGCIAPGSYLTKLNGDVYEDLGASRRALNDFHRVLGTLEETTITILPPGEMSYVRG